MQEDTTAAMGTQIRFQGPRAVGRELVDALQTDGFGPDEAHGKRLAGSGADSTSLIISLAVPLASVLGLVNQFRARPDVSISTTEDADG